MHGIKWLPNTSHCLQRYVRWLECPECTNYIALHNITLNVSVKYHAVCHFWLKGMVSCGMPRSVNIITVYEVEL
jgi:hypothetical protein